MLALGERRELLQGVLRELEVALMGVHLQVLRYQGLSGYVFRAVIGYGYTLMLRI